MKSREARHIHLALATLMAAPLAHAAQFETGDPDLKIRWDNTVKYSAIYRLQNPDANQVAKYAAAGGAADDGELNFNKGIASNRLDWTSEFDVTGKNGGARISGAAWYDAAYLGANDNRSGASNSTSAAPDHFAAPTVGAVGRRARLMDAFVYVKGELADIPGRLTLGRHAVIYGETLMAGTNGIANAQGPVDIVKAASVPGAQVKEFLLPSLQASGSLQIRDDLSIGAYYQFKWEKSPFFAPGSLLSPADFLGDAESFLPVGPFPFPKGVPRTPDLSPKRGGQGGAQLRFKAADVEYGLYAANYHDKTPSAVYLNLGVNPALAAAGVPMPDNITPVSFTQVYQQDVRTYGASASTIIGSDNVSLELSMRDRQALTGGAGFVQTILPGATPDNRDKPAYAVGKTQHMTVVDIHLFQPGSLPFLPDGGSLATQYDWHRVASVSANPGAIDPTTTSSASQVTFAFTADYFRVADGLDLSVPIVWSRNLNGRSRVYSGWVEHGGTLDLGLNFTYLTVWKGGINYRRFLGEHGVGTGAGRFQQTMWDRNFVSFNLSRSF